VAALLRPTLVSSVSDDHPAGLRPAGPRSAPGTWRDRATEDSLDCYFQEISAYSLITRDEEAALARRIHTGDCRARDDLVRSNLRFVVSVAKKYQNQGVALPDLINEGNLGLMRAARKFDETKGIKFISYAVWWIRQAILQALADQSRMVRVPLNRVGAIFRIGRRANALFQELGREATHAEIAEGLQLTEQEVARLVTAGQPCASLDAPTMRGDDDGRRLLDRLADEDGPAPDDRLIERALADAVAESLSGLGVREAMILRHYFGLDGSEPMTLEQIGALLGVTRERVRQIKATALTRLRHPDRAHALASFHA
jgi:RNA polymerase primary sigma factor